MSVAAPRPPRRLLAVPLAVFALAAACAAAMVWTLERQDRAQLRAQVADIAGDHANALQRAIGLALSANNALVALVREGQGTVTQFEEIGTQMLPFYPGIAAMGLSPGGVVRQVVPRQGNAGTIGFDQLNDPRQGAESERARESGQLTLAGPMELMQGGLGVVGRQPVYLEDDLGQRSFWGFTYVTIRLSEVLAAARLPQLIERGCRYRLWRIRPDTGHEQTIAASTPAASADAVSRVLTLPNGQWTLSLIPAAGWSAPGVLALRCAVGLLFALLMAYLAHLLVALKAHERGLAHQVAQRTAEIQATQQQLRAIIDAVPDPLFEIDLDGRCCSVHSQRAELLVAPADALVGRNVTQVLPALAAQSVLEVLHEAQSRGWSTGRQIMLDLPRLGSTWFELSAARKPDGADARPRLILLARDITQQREAQERVQHLAHFDPLTDLPNRTLLAERARRHIADAQARGEQLAMLFLDLDHFKNVNDSLGHRVGDILLVAVARRLESLLRPQDTLSRLGGDEFLLLLPSSHAAHAGEVATRILSAMAQPFQVEPYELSTTASVGVALYPADGDSFETLCQRADAAMYQAKRGGRNRHGFFTADLQARSARTLQIENALRRALERRQLELHYQPQVSLATRQIVGAEALLRWRHPELGQVSPAEFIPVAENSGMILAIGEWVLRTAVHDAKRWLDMHLPLPAISVNLSAVQCRHPQLPEMVARCLRQAGLPARRLELELTESAAIDDPAAALAMMEQLHGRGVRLSMDDFGTGYSSLSALKRFQIHKLKIDQSFVRDLDADANDRAIVSAIIRMAQALGMQTTAEGVETEGQLEFLREQGCDAGQGYLFGRPLPADAFEAYLRTHRDNQATTEHVGS
ncbi:EAL domain-containing protein [Verminephrobacter aporrectodeae subsp. tuberculatae]|uniref:bifunctional diguanylate cyclase/phosphodiesterase n=1 Tax=Verminephrobacter aporrectodeae TaxID=1110389 RepID=UPI002242EA17|nr:EAL domain-containing protein [Verminephrobacter aporrectodeae]MCW8199895.1 EAL domain-containing protein [Verminephrobacter aporrectodeae subsp. tuberculatae]